MEERKRNKLEDFPDLLQVVQLLLPLKDAVRTSILSKAWLDAWSAIHILMFPNDVWLFSEQERNYMDYIDRTLIRYYRDNIPVRIILLEVNVMNQETASLVEKWIRSVASKSTLKELYLKICCYEPSFTLTDEIFCGENLSTISVELDTWMLGSLFWISKNPVIKCRSLRVLEMIGVNITEDVLDELLSTCKLLEKINLSFHKGLKTIKVKSLHYLRELKITSKGQNDSLEIDDVPNLSLVFYDSLFEQREKPLPFQSCSLRNVTQLHVGGVIMDYAFFNMLKSSCPILESLTLDIWIWGMENMYITNFSLKNLTIQLLDRTQIHIQVYAPKLRLFTYVGETIHILSFPVIVPEQIKLILDLKNPLDQSFFVNMRNALNLLSKFDIEIRNSANGIIVPLNIDVDDLRRSVSFPATKVQQLLIKTLLHEQFLDAFYLICHPNYLKVQAKIIKDNKINLYKEMVGWMMKNKAHDLKNVQMKNPYNGKWEALTTSSWTTSLDRSTDLVEFKLNWRLP